MGNRKGMTEPEWLCADPEQMTCWHPERMIEEAARRRVGKRKLRLFAAACCRQIIWHLLPEACQNAVSVVERYADGQAGTEELRAAHAQALADQGAAKSEQAEAAAAVAGMAAAAEGFGGHLTMICRNPWYAIDESAGLNAVLTAAEECALIRDIVGNPFRPVTVSRARRTRQLVLLAQAAYEHRELPSGTLDGARLAVLADALEEAGCPDQDILGHLRGPGPHVRGCWALDLLLGKE
jgi:hypothetical protein